MMKLRRIARRAGSRHAAVWFFVGLAAVIVVASVVLGANVSTWWYAGVLGVVPVGVAGRRFSLGMAAARLREELRQSWACEDDRERRFDLLERDLHRLAGDAVSENALDEHTWTDLDMDSVFARLDRTLTLPGESMLYAMVRCPETKEPALLERDRLIRLFQSDAALRESVRLELSRLGRADNTDVTGLLWGRRVARPAIASLFLPLTVLAVSVACGAAVWSASPLVLALIPVFLTNFIVTDRIRSKVYAQINALRYLGATIGRARSLAAVGPLEPSGMTAELETLIAQVASIESRARLLRPERGASSEIADLAFEYISTYFLVEARTFYGVLDELDRHRKSLRRLFELIGTLDACQSVASFREELPCYVEPEFVSDNGVCLDIAEGRHPLLSRPVANSLAPTAPGVFISGSNMSGKSTFLRTVALNAILAQSIYTCYATAYRASFFAVLSSINHADELDEGKSYYLVEAERLLRIVRAAEGERPCLCVIDELLRGTNSAERTSASAAILEYLCEQNALVLVASHDAELAQTVSDRIEHYHFADRFDDGQLHFDYRLYKGRATTQNAINVLESLGYPAEITDAARARFDGMS